FAHIIAVHHQNGVIFFVLGDFQDGGKRLFSEQLPRCPFAEAQGAQVLPVLNPTFPLLLSFVFEEGTFPFLPSFLELLPQLADRVIVIQFFIAKGIPFSANGADQPVLSVRGVGTVVFDRRQPSFHFGPRLFEGSIVGQFLQRPEKFQAGIYLPFCLLIHLLI